MAEGIVLCDPCLFDETETEAVGFCGICVEYLCNGCIKDHRKAKMTRNHKIQSEDIPRNAEVIKEMIELKVCPLHNDMDITYRCHDHYSYVCTVCRVDSHRNCKNVLELAQADNAGNVFQDIHDSLIAIDEKADIMVKRSEQNKSSLIKKQAKVLNEQEKILQRAINDIEDLKVKCRKETHEKIQAVLSAIDFDLDTFEELKKSSARYQEILEAALKYDNDSCPRVIRYQLEDKVMALKGDLEDIEQKGQFKIIFERNPDCVSISRPGTLSVTRHANEDTKSATDGVKYSLEKSSDEVRESVGAAALPVSKGTVHKAMIPTPFRDITVHKRAQLFDVRGFNEKKICSIVGSVVLPNDQAVVIDCENSSIKLLSSQLTVLDVLRLPGKPLHMCAIDKYAVAVSFIRVKRINRYFISVSDNEICYDGGFATTLFNHGITFNGIDIVAVMSDVDFLSNNSTKSNTIQIEIRNVFTGSVDDTITDFKVVGKNSRPLVLNDTQALCCTPDGIVLAEMSRILKFSMRKEQGTTVAIQKRFSTCSWKTKEYIVNVTSDDNSVYVCTENGCVFQHSVADLRQNRVILSNAGKLLRSICVDNTSNRIIVGRNSDDDISVYSFTRKT